MADWLIAAGSWGWIVAGLVLLGLELVVPGGFLVWLGVAGIVTGILTMFVPLYWPAQWLVFGGLALVAIFVWQRFAKVRFGKSDSSFLNRRVQRFIGQELVLESAIVDGFGRVALGDTVWRVAGPELPAGHRVRVVAADGAMLIVEAIAPS